MTHGSLFSGIGGFDLAAQWMNWENVFHCEINPFGRRVLSYYWPDAISYIDIKTTDFTPHAQRIDVLSGGFPCQPYSIAGKRKGKEDDRHLWPAMLSAIKVIQPRWIVGENVHGIINWSKGLVFHEIQTELEIAGYEVWAYVLPACGINAPHRRDRTFFIAHANRIGYGRLQQEFGAECEDTPRIGGTCEAEIITNSDSNGQFRSNCQNEINANERGEYAFNDVGQVREFTPNASGKRLEGYVFGEQRSDEKPHEKYSGSSFDRGITEAEQWQAFPTQSPICNGNDGIPAELDGITFSNWRKESIKGGGNAVVPPLVCKIFKTIEEYETK